MSIALSIYRYVLSFYNHSVIRCKLSRGTFIFNNSFLLFSSVRLQSNVFKIQLTKLAEVRFRQANRGLPLAIFCMFLVIINGSSKLLTCNHSLMNFSSNTSCFLFLSINLHFFHVTKNILFRRLNVSHESICFLFMVLPMSFFVSLLMICNHNIT